MSENTNEVKSFKERFRNAKRQAAVHAFKTGTATINGKFTYKYLEIEEVIDIVNKACNEENLDWSQYYSFDNTGEFCVKILVTEVYNVDKGDEDFYSSSLVMTKVRTEDIPKTSSGNPSRPINQYLKSLDTTETKLALCKAFGFVGKDSNYDESFRGNANENL